MGNPREDWLRKKGVILLERYPEASYGALPGILPEEFDFSIIRNIPIYKKMPRKERWGSTLRSYRSAFMCVSETVCVCNGLSDKYCTFILCIRKTWNCRLKWLCLLDL